VVVVVVVVVVCVCVCVGGGGGARGAGRVKRVSVWTQVWPVWSLPTKVITGPIRTDKHGNTLISNVFKGQDRPSTPSHTNVSRTDGRCANGVRGVDDCTHTKMNVW
jgi:hypothetical protein